MKLRMSDKVKGAAATVLVIVLVLALAVVYKAAKRDINTGKQAAAYLDALIRLGQMPTGAQVEQMIAKAAAQIQGEYVAPPGGPESARVNAVEKKAPAPEKVPATKPAEVKK